MSNGSGIMDKGATPCYPLAILLILFCCGIAANTSFNTLLQPA